MRHSTEAYYPGAAVNGRKNICSEFCTGINVFGISFITEICGFIFSA